MKRKRFFLQTLCGENFQYLIFPEHYVNLALFSDPKNYIGSTEKKITKSLSEKENEKSASGSFAIFRRNFASALYTYDGLERLENSAPLGPGCGGRAEESHLLCIEHHRDIAYKRPSRPQSLLFVDWHRFDADPDPILMKIIFLANSICLRYNTHI